jgi:hypothetical protein
MTTTTTLMNREFAEVTERFPEEIQNIIFGFSRNSLPLSLRTEIAEERFFTRFVENEIKLEDLDFPDYYNFIFGAFDNYVRINEDLVERVHMLDILREAYGGFITGNISGAGYINEIYETLYLEKSINCDHLYRDVIYRVWALFTMKERSTMLKLQNKNHHCLRYTPDQLREIIANLDN